MSNKILTGVERKAQLLEAGARLASKHGAQNITRRMVAQACGCAEGLVSVYMGTSDQAQKAYARKAKSLGLSLPSKADAEAMGAKLRAHGPRDKRDTRKRSAKEVEAIKRKIANPKVRVRMRTTRSGATVVEMSSRGSGVDLRDVVTKMAGVETKPKPGRERKPRPSPATPIPTPGDTQSPTETKTAARPPMAPPSS